MGILERVKQENLTARAVGIGDLSSRLRMKLVNDNTSPMENQGRNNMKNIKEHMENGESPLEVWEDFVNNLESNKHCRHWVLKTDEDREKWEQAKASGKSEEFWYEYWDEFVAKNPRRVRRHVQDWHPRQVQERWGQLSRDGVPPDQIWEELHKDTPVDRHGGWGPWDRRRRGGDRDGPDDRGHWGRCRHEPRRCGKKPNDESEIFKQFDFL